MTDPIKVATLDGLHKLLQSIQADQRLEIQFKKDLVEACLKRIKDEYLNMYIEMLYRDEQILPEDK